MANTFTARDTLKTKLLAALGSATSADQIVKLSRTIEKANLDDDADLETALDTKVSAMASTASTEDIEKLAFGVKKLRTSATATDPVSTMIPEGSSNLYVTDSRVRSSFSASGDLSYDSGTGVLSYTALPDALTVYATVADLPATGVSAGSKGLVEENKKLYIFTGASWVGVGLVDQKPVMTTNPDGSYTLSPGADTVITLNATDPQGDALTWSYVVSSGALGGSSIAQADNVFTITGSSNTADTASFSITFRVSDGTNIADAVSEFTVNFGPDWSGITKTAFWGNLYNPPGGSNQHVGPWGYVGVTKYYQMPGAGQRAVTMNSSVVVIAHGQYHDRQVGSRWGAIFAFDHSGNFLWRKQGGYWSSYGNPADVLGENYSDMWLGQAVVSTDNYIAVSAPEAWAPVGPAAGKNGQVFILDNAGTLVHTINGPATSTGESGFCHFGLEMKTQTWGGIDYLLVGAGKQINGNPNPNVGEIFIYRMDTGAQVTSLKAAYGVLNPLHSDKGGVGTSFDVSEDYIAIWQDTKLMTPSNYDQNDYSNDRFYINGSYMRNNRQGGSVHLIQVNSGDPSNLTYLREITNPVDRSTVAWTQSWQENTIGFRNDRFGRNMSISGDKIAVAADGLWRLDVSANGNEEVGKVYVFEISTGNLLYSIDAPVVESWSLFGFTLSFTDDGSVLIVGRESAGHGGPFYLFNSSDGSLLTSIDSPEDGNGRQNNQRWGTVVNTYDNKIVVVDPLETHPDASYDYDGTAYIFEA